MRLPNEQQIVEILLNGGVVACVTDTVWGLACMPDNPAAVEKMYAIKHREPTKPLILMSNDIGYLIPYVRPLSESAKQLIRRHFPGALTVIVPKSLRTPNYVTAGLPNVGIRVPDNDVFKRLCVLVPGHVLATTSANISNEPAALTYKQTLAALDQKVDYIIPDKGHVCQGLASTVCAVTDSGIEILRQGAVHI